MSNSALMVPRSAMVAMAVSLLATIAYFAFGSKDGKVETNQENSQLTTGDANAGVSDDGMLRVQEGQRRESEAFARRLLPETDKQIVEPYSDLLTRFLVTLATGKVDQVLPLKEQLLRHPNPSQEVFHVQFSKYILDTTPSSIVAHAGLIEHLNEIGTSAILRGGSESPVEVWLAVIGRVVAVLSNTLAASSGTPESVAEASMDSNACFGLIEKLRLALPIPKPFPAALPFDSFSEGTVISRAAYFRAQVCSCDCVGLAGASQNLGYIIRLLTESPDALVKKAALRALSRLQSGEAVVALHSELQQMVAAGRWDRAREAMGNAAEDSASPESVVPILFSMVDDVDNEVHHNGLSFAVGAGLSRRNPREVASVIRSMVLSSDSIKVWAGLPLAVISTFEGTRDEALLRRLEDLLVGLKLVPQMKPIGAQVAYTNILVAYCSVSASVSDTVTLLQRIANTGSPIHELVVIDALINCCASMFEDGKTTARDVAPFLNLLEEQTIKAMLPPSRNSGLSSLGTRAQDYLRRPWLACDDPTVSARLTQLALNGASLGIQQFARDMIIEWHAKHTK